MITKKNFKNIGTAISLCIALSVAAGTSQAAIVSSYDSSASVFISANFDGVDLETIALDSGLTTTGLGSGTQNGSADDLISLTIDQQEELFATADGQINNGPGSVESFRLTDGVLMIDNTDGTSALTGNVTFSYELLASLFTDSVDENGFSYASIVVYDDGNDFIDEFLEIESELLGTDEQLSFTDTFVLTINVAAGDFYEIVVELDAGGITESVREPIVNVPAPAGLAIFSVGLAFLLSRRVRNS